VRAASQKVSSYDPISITKDQIADTELLDELIDSVMIHDANNNIVFVNRFAYESRGYTKAEMLKMKITDLVTDSYKTKVPEHVEKSHQFGGYLFESVHARKDGSEFPVEVWVKPIIYNGEKCLVGLARDITRRKVDHELAVAQIDESYARLQRVIDGVVGALSKTVETKDPYTAGHQQRVANLAREISKDMGFSESETRSVYMAATIHDIGKIYVPAEILNKPGQLSRIEFEIIKMHPKTGYEVLKDIDFVGPVAKMILQHHERMDGSGYPNGDKGDAINPGARILAVSDVVEAMSSHRPYRAGLGIGPALEEIAAKSGILYDNDAANACLKLFETKRFSFSD
jgi:PAS domain S-box-containing protein